MPLKNFSGSKSSDERGPKSNTQYLLFVTSELRKLLAEVESKHTLLHEAGEKSPVDAHGEHRDEVAPKGHEEDMLSVEAGEKTRVDAHGELKAEVAPKGHEEHMSSVEAGEKSPVHAHGEHKAEVGPKPHDAHGEHEAEVAPKGHEEHISSVDAHDGEHKAELAPFAYEEDISSEKTYYFDVGVIGAGIGGCEVVRLLARNKLNKERIKIALMDESAEIFQGTSGAMARRMGNGGHYHDPDSVDYYAMAYDLTETTFIRDPVVFQNADARTDFDETRKRVEIEVDKSSPLAEDKDIRGVQIEEATSVEATPVDYKSIYVVAKGSPVNGDELAKTHDARLTLEEQNKYYEDDVVNVDKVAKDKSSDGLGYIFHGKHDGVLDLSFVVDSYKAFFDSSKNVSFLKRHWVHSFHQIKLDEIEKVEGQDRKKYITSLKEDFLSNLQAEHGKTEEETDQYSIQLDAEIDKVIEKFPDYNKKPIVVFGLEGQGTEEDPIKPFVRAYGHLHLAAYDGNTKLLHRSQFFYDKERLEYVEEKSKSVEDRPGADEPSTPEVEAPSRTRALAEEMAIERYRSRRKFAVELNQKVSDSPVTFIQGPYASMLRRYLTAELVTNIPTSHTEWGFFIQRKMSSIYKENVHHVTTPFLETWLVVLQETLLRKRTPVQEPLTKDEKDFHGTLSDVVMEQYAGVSEKYYELNDTISREISAIYLALLLQYYNSDLESVEYIPFIPFEWEEKFAAVEGETATERNKMKIFEYIKHLKEQSIEGNILYIITKIFTHLVENGCAENIRGEGLNISKEDLDLWFKDDLESSRISCEDLRLTKQRILKHVESFNEFFVDNPSTTSLFQVSDLSKRMKHFYESVIGIWIIQTAANLFPILHFDKKNPGHSNDFLSGVFCEFSDAVFDSESSLGMWPIRAALFLNPFNIHNVLTGEVLRVANSDDAPEVIKLIASPRSSVSKCREEKPWSAEGGHITGAVTKKFWHGCHLALQAVNLISKSFKKHLGLPVNGGAADDRSSSFKLSQSGSNTPTEPRSPERTPPPSPVRVDEEVTASTSTTVGIEAIVSELPESGESTRLSRLVDRALLLIKGDENIVELDTLSPVPCDEILREKAELLLSAPSCEPESKEPLVTQTQSVSM